MYYRLADVEYDARMVRSGPHAQISDFGGRCERDFIGNEKGKGDAKEAHKNPCCPWFFGMVVFQCSRDPD